MNILDAYEKLNISRELSNITSKRAFYGSSVLDEEMLAETSISNIVALKLGYGLDKRKLVEFLIKLDTIAYVPFGKNGMKALDEVLDEFVGGKNSVDFKTEKMTTALKNNGVEISDDLMKAIENFCKQYIGSNFDLSDPVSLAAIVRRLSGELENSIVSGLINGKSRDDALEQLLDQLVNDTNEKNRSVNLDSYFPKEMNNGELSETNKDYLRKITGIAFLGKISD